MGASNLPPGVTDAMIDNHFNPVMECDMCYKEDLAENLLETLDHPTNGFELKVQIFQMGKSQDASICLDCARRLLKEIMEVY